MPPQSVFADAFRRHVQPVLRSAIFFQVIRPGVTFDEAVGEVLALAHVRGAGWLPDEQFRDLVDWIGATFLDDAAFLEEVRSFGLTGG